MSTTATFVPGNASIGWPSQLVYKLPAPPPPAPSLNPSAGTSTTSWAAKLGAVSQFINTTFPTIYGAVTGKPVLAGPSIGVSPHPAAPSPGPPLTVEQRSEQIQRWLLLAGVTVLGVALALSLAKKQKEG